MGIRTYAANINLKYDNVEPILDFTNKFINKVFVERAWGHLNECEAYNVDLDLSKIVSDSSALYMNRFNKYPNRKDAPEWDYFGVRGKSLLKLLPEWSEKVELFKSVGLHQLVDTPCILVTNRQVVLHRDGRPDQVPGYTNRHCGINYLLFNNSPYLTGVWSESDKTRGNNFEGLEHTQPAALIEYDRNSMNLMNTSLPHGSYVDPKIEPPPSFAPRAFITMGFTCSYIEAREKLNRLVKKDW